VIWSYRVFTGARQELCWNALWNAGWSRRWEESGGKPGTTELPPSGGPRLAIGPSYRSWITAGERGFGIGGRTYSSVLLLMGPGREEEMGGGGGGVKTWGGWGSGQENQLLVTKKVGSLQRW